MASPTILDSLIIELGLDSSRFRQGADEAERGARKAKDETERSAKDIQKAVGEGVSNAFQTATTRVIEFLGVLAGARTLEQFAVGATQSATQLGIMSRTLGMAPDRVSAIALAVERTGGSANSTIQSLQRLKDMQTQVAISGGTVPQELQRLGVDVRGAESPEDLLNRTVEAMRRSPRNLTQSQQIAILRGLGVDDATANFWVTRGAAGERQAVGDTQRDAVTPAQVSAATQLTVAWNGAAQAVQSVGREITRTVSPAIVALLAHVREIIEANKGAIEDWVGDKVKAAVDWLSDPATWKEARSIFDDIKRKIDEVAQAAGGWKVVSEALVGLWALDKISPIITAVGLLTMAFRGLASSLLFAEGSQLLTAVGALAVGYLVTEGTHPAVDPDAAARSMIDLQRRLKHDTRPVTDEDVRRMKEFQKLPWYGRLFTTPDQLADDQRMHPHGVPFVAGKDQSGEKPISTAEGPVSEGRPLPVKIVGGTSTPPLTPPPPADTTPAPADAAPAAQPNILKRAWNWVTGGGSSAPAAPASTPPVHPHTPTPGLVVPEPSAPSAPTGHFKIIDPSTDPHTSHQYPAVGEKSSYLGGSSLFASAQAQRVAGHARGSSNVTIEAMNWHPAPDSRTAKNDYYREHIKRDFFAMKSDVGLA